MKKLNGIAVSPGVVIGEAMIVDSQGFAVHRKLISSDDVDSEIARLAEAIEAAGQEISRNQNTVSSELGTQYGAIFAAHLQMLNDSHLRTELESMIRDRHYAAEYAVSRVFRRYVQVFERLESQHLAERANDVSDIEQRLLRHLLGEERHQLSNLSSPVLIVARNLTPSETANLDRKFVLGFATEMGGPSSHTAIVAEALEIPAVVGTGSLLTELVDGDTIIIDGDEGAVILHPDEETLANYRRQEEDHRTAAAKLLPLRDLPAETLDGVRIDIYGNIEFPYEVEHCVQRGADGIGLYRTEFLYLGRDVLPNEEVHYQAYKKVVEAMGDLPVTIRTFDLGADKIPQMAESQDERNPFLGLRSIRLALRNLPMFREQLRAAIRVSAIGNVWIMFPLISTLLELRQAKMVLADVYEDLEEKGIPFKRDIKIGMMVEVPAAAIQIDRFVEEVDFLSIGTNDLVQYTLAVDRSNSSVVDLYNPADPAVLRLVRRTIEVADQKGVPVNMCGQMSGNPLYTMLLLGLGLRKFSVTPIAISEIKNMCRHVTIEQCKAVADHVMEMEHARDIKSYLREENRRWVPKNGD